MKDAPTSASKLLSLVLRHQPEAIGLSLDQAGWADVDELLACLQATGKPIDRAMLEQIVATSDKQRFAFNGDRTRIRASQGHSIQVDLGLQPAMPPPRLFHGTASRFLESIERTGLEPRERHHVHLSADAGTATAVGRRHGPPVVLAVDAGAMHAAGFRFYRSDNGVWLTDAVPPQYLSTM